MNYGLKAHVARFGVILSNVSIAAIFLGFMAFLSALFGVVVPLLVTVAGYLILIVANIITFGMLLTSPNFKEIPEKLNEFTASSGVVIQSIFQSTPYFLIIGLITAVVSFIFMFAEPSVKKHTGRLVFSGVVSVLGLIVLVMFYTGMVSV